MTTDPEVLVESNFPGVVVRPGVFRHLIPDTESVHPPIGEGIKHTQVTTYSGDAIGELCRWVWNNDDSTHEVFYEAWINGLEEAFGLGCVVASKVPALADLTFVADSLRCEWEIINGIHEGQVWHVPQSNARPLIPLTEVLPRRDE